MWFLIFPDEFVIVSCVLHVVLPHYILSIVTVLIAVIESKLEICASLSHVHTRIRCELSLGNRTNFCTHKIRHNCSMHSNWDIPYYNKKTENDQLIMRMIDRGAWLCSPHADAVCLFDKNQLQILHCMLSANGCHHFAVTYDFRLFINLKLFHVQNIRAFAKHNTTTTHKPLNP